MWYENLNVSTNDNDVTMLQENQNGRRLASDL